MSSVRVRKLTNLAIYVDPRKYIDVEQTYCHDCVNPAAEEIDCCPGEYKDTSTGIETVLVHLHYKSQFNIIFNPSTKAKRQHLGNDIQK